MLEVRPTLAPRNARRREEVLSVDFHLPAVQQQGVVTVRQAHKERLAVAGEVASRIQQVALGLGEQFEQNVALQHALSQREEQLGADIRRKAVWAVEGEHDVIGERRRICRRCRAACPLRSQWRHPAS